MSDHPPENPGPGTSAAAGDRSLNEILEELARISGAQRGEAAAMRAAVSELSRALAMLFEMVRTDRAENRARIAELEAALSEAHARVRQLEAGEQLPMPAPPPNDFGQLREAAERLRLRTEQLVRDAGTPAEAHAAKEAEEAEAAEVAAVADSVNADAATEADPLHADPVDEPEADQAARIEAARKAVEASLAEDAAAQAEAAEERAAESADEAFGRPGVLRIFPGAVLGPNADEDFDVESELDLGEEPRRAAAQATPTHAEPETPARGWPIPSATTADRTPEATTVDAPVDPPTAGETASVAAAPPAPPTRVREPISIEPRPARKRRGLRRRKIDARKLGSVDPETALRAMVSAIDDIWTAGHTLDLIVALTDGSTLKVSGGHTRPLEVHEVEPGTPARSTVTATSAQLVPLFGRLELTGDQSTPLIHGSRGDADLLVGWIDRAQRLTAEPL